MVCQRCIIVVKSLADQLNLPYNSIELGEVSLKEPLTESLYHEFECELQKVGFELINSRLQVIIDKVKLAVLHYLEEIGNTNRANLSTHIARELNYDYSYLSNLFSSVEGLTIEQYFIQQRVEKVKEFIVYDQFSLSEIAYRLGYSSVHHLSSQFKKQTGLTPSYFRKIAEEKRLKK